MNTDTPALVINKVQYTITKLHKPISLQEAIEYCKTL